MGKSHVPAETGEKLFRPNKNGRILIPMSILTAYRIVGQKK